MKTTVFHVLLFATIAALTGCKKDMHLIQKGELRASEKKTKSVKRAYQDNFVTWYQFVPDVANGWDASRPGPYLAWYPGGGDGHATHIGNAKTFFNQYVPFAPPLFSSVPAPVTMFFSSQLSASGFNGIPVEVSSIVYDDKGNSIWFHQTSNATTPTNATRIDFTATADIVGGTGKFIGATGEVALQGYFNPQNQQDAGVGSKGWIEY